MRTKSEIFQLWKLQTPGKVQLQKTEQYFSKEWSLTQPYVNHRALRKQYANMLGKFDTGSQVFGH